MDDLADPRRSRHRRHRRARARRRPQHPRRPDCRRRDALDAAGPARDRRARAGGRAGAHRHPHALGLHAAAQPARGVQDPPGRHDWRSSATAASRRPLRCPGARPCSREYLASSAPWLPFARRQLRAIRRGLSGHLRERHLPGRSPHAAADDRGDGEPPAHGRRARHDGGPARGGAGRRRLGAVVRALHRARRLRRRRRDPRAGPSAAPARRRLRVAHPRRGRRTCSRPCARPLPWPRRRACTCRSRTSSCRASTTGAAPRACSARSRRRARRGLPVDCDAYPYDTATNPLRNLLPRWVMDGGIPARCSSGSAAPTCAARLRDDIARDGAHATSGGIPVWDAVRIAVSPHLPEEAGQTLGEIARGRSASIPSTPSATSSWPTAARRAS